MQRGLKQILYQIIYGEKWVDIALPKSPYMSAWREVQANIRKAKEYDDWKAVQKLNVPLQWLVSIDNYALDKSVEELRRNDTSLKRLKLYEVLDRLDTGKLRKQNRIKFKNNQLLPPEIFDLENYQHRKFAFDVTHDYEVVIHQTKFQNLPVIEQSLSFPKDFIHNALSFFSKFCTYDEHGVEEDYVIEMREKLVEFV